MSVRFNVDRGWPDSRGSAIDETYVPAALETLTEGSIVTLGGAVGSPTVAEATAPDLAAALALSTTDTYTDAAVNTAVNAAVDAITALIDSEPLFVVIEGNVAANGHLSGSWLNKCVCLIAGGMSFSLPTAMYDLNGGTAATVFAPGSPVTVASGLISARNDGTADRANFAVFGWVEDFNAATGLLSVIRK